MVCPRCLPIPDEAPDISATTKGGTAKPIARSGASSWRLAHDPETRAYFERRLKEGRTNRDVIRILKRYVAREVYRHLPRGSIPESGV